MLHRKIHAQLRLRWYQPKLEYLNLNVQSICFNPINALITFCPIIYRIIITFCVCAIEFPTKTINAYSNSAP